MDTIDALAACLPPVSYDTAGTEIRRDIGAAAAVLDAVIASADQVVIEQQPNLTSVALPDWERNYALPDDGLGGPLATEAQRRAALLARITAQGNLSRQHLNDLAAVVGFPGTSITEYDVLTCEDPCDLPVADENWIGAWRMDAPAGVADQEQLRSLMQRRKPAHTFAFVNFVS